MPVARYSLEKNSKPANDGRYQLMFKIYFQGENKRVLLGNSIEQKYWKKRKNQQGYYLSSSCPDSGIIKEKFSDLRAKAENYLLNKRGKKITVSDIQRHLKGESYESFFIYGYMIMKKTKEEGKIGQYKSIKSKLNILKKYLDGKDLFFSDITVAFLNKYIHHLKVVRGNAVNTIKDGHIKYLKKIYNQAISERVIDGSYNPFTVLCLKGEKSKKERLNQDGIEKIKKLELQDQGFCDARNIFLFSFYCGGIRISDALKLTWKCIDFQNKRVSYRMGKSKKEIDIALPPYAFNIILNYKKQINSIPGVRNADLFIFPFLDNRLDYSDPEFLHNKISSKTSFINRKLKIIAALAGVTRKLSTHIVRHSFANIAANTDGINVRSIQDILGHSSIKTTENYLGEFDKSKTDNTLKKLFDF